MKLKSVLQLRFSKVLCSALVVLMAIQPALLCAHDFGGNSVPGTPPGAANSGGQGGGGLGGLHLAGNIAGGNVYLHDGSEFFSSVDLSLRGVFPIRFIRYYNSRSIYDSPLGYGWDFSYNERLFTYSDGSVVIRWSTGFKKRFVFSGGAFVSDDGLPGDLVQNPDGTFIFTSLRGMKHYFDLNGCLTRIQDYHGNSLRMTYTSNKKPLTGTSPYSIDPANPQIVSYDYQLTRVEEWYATGNFSGRYIDLAYDDTSGRLISLTDFTGRSINYQHDSNGNLIRINYPESLFKTYLYEDPNDLHNITGIGRGYGANEPSIQFENTYDDQDRVISQAHGKTTLTFNYEIPLLRTKVTTTVKDDHDTILHQFDTVYEYDEKGHLIKFTDAEGNVGEYIRDTRGNCIREIVWKNQGTPSSPSLTEERIINHTYDSDSNLTSTTIKLDSGEIIKRYYTWNHGWLETWSTSSSLDPGKVYQGKNIFEYSNGYPIHISQIRTLSSKVESPSYFTVTLDYSPIGQLTSITYDNGDQETFQYTNGYLTDLNGFQMVKDIRGNTISATDRNNNQTTYEYDSLDRMIKATNALNEETRLNYSGYNLASIEYGRFGTEQGIKWLFTYDSLGRINSYYTLTEGSPAMRQDIEYDGNSNVIKVTDASGQIVSYEYDNKNRLISITDPASGTTSFHYDVLGRMVQATDPNGLTTAYYYDDLNRLIAVEKPGGHKATFAYNALGLVTKITDARGKVQSFGYDLAGRRVWSRMPMGQIEYYHYDGRGRMDYRINANGQRIEYGYNGRNMLETMSLSSESPRSLSFTYDSEGNVLTFTDSSFSSSPIYSYTYDPLNRPDTVTLHPINKTIDYDYNHFNGLNKLTCKSGSSELFSYTYAYDAAGRVTSLLDMPSNRTTHFSYDTVGRLSNITFGNSATANVAYKPNGAYDQIQFSKSDTSPIESLSYSTDNIGNVTGMTSNQGSSSFAYDDQYQLTSATFPAGSGLGTETYSYDGTGNRLSSSDAPAWSYDDNGRLISYGSSSFTYDNEGNRLTKTTGTQTTNYSYDFLNRLQGINTSGVSANYVYDHLGRRIKKQVNGSETWYLYDGNRLIAQFSSGGSLVRRYGYDPMGYDPISIGDGSGIYALLSDHKGTPFRVLDENQNTIWQADYQAFGKGQINEDPDSNGMNFVCDLRFPGQFFDSESGLHYNIARYYDPETGTYLQRDPVVRNPFDPLSMNRYPYAFNNPVTMIDPDGRMAVATMALIAAIAGVILAAYGAYGTSQTVDKLGIENFRQVNRALRGDPNVRWNREMAEDGARGPLGNNLPPVLDRIIPYLDRISNDIGDRLDNVSFEPQGLSWSQWWQLHVENRYDDWSDWFWERREYYTGDERSYFQRGCDWTNRRIDEIQSWGSRVYTEYRPVLDHHLSNAWQGIRGAWNWLGSRLSALGGQVRNWLSGK